MKIKLVRDVFVSDRFGNKSLRSTVRFSRNLAFEWRAGVEMEVSEASGKKMIENGDAVKIEEEAVQ